MYDAYSAQLLHAIAAHEGSFSRQRGFCDSIISLAPETSSNFERKLASNLLEVDICNDRKLQKSKRRLLDKKADLG